MKVCFVILHYNTMNETEECIKSIKDLCEKDIKIIITDNASPNGTGKMLFEKYKKDRIVDVLLNNDNLGFAQGNNVGYRYAKEKYNPDFIVVSNNDVLFFQKEFVSFIERIYLKRKFYVLGPDILDITQTQHSNPLNEEGPTLKEAKKWMRCFKKKLMISYIKHFICCLHLPKIQLGRGDYPEIMNNYTIEEPKENVVIHGCCLVVSKLFIDNMDWLFYPKTFLFNEEYVLWEWCRKYNYLIVYDPSAKIIHNEHASINTLSSSSTKKQIFAWKEQIKSLSVLIDIKQKFN